MTPFNPHDEVVDLLLLPTIALPVEQKALSVAYGDAVDNALRASTPKDPRVIRRLDVAVKVPAILATRSRSTVYPSVHDIVREVYTLICLCAARNEVELDFPGGIDARVFLVYEVVTNDLINFVKSDRFPGPLVDWDVFTASRRPYQNLYSADSEEGRLLRENFGLARREMSTIGSNSAVDNHSDDNKNTMPTKQEQQKYHPSVAVGGTFDHLHIGHKLLLTATAFVPQVSPSSTSEPDTKSRKNARKITIGITGDQLLVNKKHSTVLESWSARQTSTAKFVESILVFEPTANWTRQVEHINNPEPNGKIVRLTYSSTPATPSATKQQQQEEEEEGREHAEKEEKEETITIDYTHITDPFGPTITDPEISALIISEETREGGQAVNDKRQEKGWTKLDVFEVNVLDADVAAATAGKDGKATDKTNFEGKISSTDIRRRLVESKIKL